MDPNVFFGLQQQLQVQPNHPQAAQMVAWMQQQAAQNQYIQALTMQQQQAAATQTVDVWNQQYQTAVLQTMVENDALRARIMEMQQKIVAQAQQQSVAIVKSVDNKPDNCDSKLEITTPPEERPDVYIKPEPVQTKPVLSIKPEVPVKSEVQDVNPLLLLAASALDPEKTGVFLTPGGDSENSNSSTPPSLETLASSFSDDAEAIVPKKKRKIGEKGKVAKASGSQKAMKLDLMSTDLSRVRFSVAVSDKATFKQLGEWFRTSRFLDEKEKQDNTVFLIEKWHMPDTVFTKSSRLQDMAKKIDEALNSRATRKRKTPEQYLQDCIKGGYSYSNPVRVTTGANLADKAEDDPSWKGSNEMTPNLVISKAIKGNGTITVESSFGEHLTLQLSGWHNVACSNPVSDLGSETPSRAPRSVDTAWLDSVAPTLAKKAMSEERTWCKLGHGHTLVQESSRNTALHSAKCYLAVGEDKKTFRRWSHMGRESFDSVEDMLEQIEGAIWIGSKATTPAWEHCDDFTEDGEASKNGALAIHQRDMKQWPSTSKAQKIRTARGEASFADVFPKVEKFLSKANARRWVEINVREEDALLVAYQGQKFGPSCQKNVVCVWRSLMKSSYSSLHQAFADFEDSL